MEHIILWIIGIIIYLAIGFGMKSSSNNLLKMGLIDYYYWSDEKIWSILEVLIWPVELGDLLFRAKAYYQIKLNLLHSYNKAWNSTLFNNGGIIDPVSSQLTDIKFKVDRINDSLENIKKMTQKNIDMKEANNE